MKSKDFKIFLSKSAAFSEGRLDQLQEDLNYLEKTAVIGEVSPFIRSAANAAAAVLAGAATSAGLAYYLAKRRQDRHQDNLYASYDTLLTDPKFQKNTSTFHKRFSELSLIAPTVASNPLLASKVLAPRMGKGFNLEDIHRLSSIEHSAANAIRPELPSVAARTEAIVGATNAFKQVLPSLIDSASRSLVTDKVVHEGKTTTIHTSNPAASKQMQEMQKHFDATLGLARAAEERIAELGENAKPGHFALRDQAARRLADIEKQYTHHEDPQVREAYAQMIRKAFEPGHKKEGSAMRPVSEECLGRMLAETHVMCKEAGIVSSTTKWLGAAGGTDVAKYLKVMTVPLAIGVGIKMIQGYMDSRNKSQLHAEADRVYANLKRTSDVVQENLPIANEAFDALKSFAPALAVKPIIAKTFVENVVNSQGHLDPNTANMLAQTQQAVQTIERHTGGGFIAALKEPMGIFQFKKPGIVEK